MCLAGCDWLSRGEAVGCLQPIKTQALRSCYGVWKDRSREYGVRNREHVVDGETDLRVVMEEESVLDSAVGVFLQIYLAS